MEKYFVEGTMKSVECEKVDQILANISEMDAVLAAKREILEKDPGDEAGLKALDDRFTALLKAFTVLRESNEPR